MTTVAPLAMFFLLAAAPGPGAAPVGEGVAGAGVPGLQPPPRVLNQVLDLFDGELLLDTASATDHWESRDFPVAAFDRLGLRLSAEPGPSSAIACAPAWQFAPDDAFVASATVAVAFPNLTGSSAGQGFERVNGTRARIVCRPVFSGLGNDPDVNPPASGVLTDVKVLLRRE